jgi:hypothetical protein
VTASLALLLAVGAAYLAARVAFDWLGRRFLIVSGAEYLVLGILLGPQITGLLKASVVDNLAPILTLALGWIGAIVGMQFELRKLLSIPPRAFRIAFAESAMTFVVVAGVEFFAIRWLLDPGEAEAMIAAVAIGATAVASSNAGIALVSEMTGANGSIVEQLRLSSSINSLVAIVIFGLLLCVHHVAAPASRPLTATEWGVVSVAIGVLGGSLFHVFLGDTPDGDRLFVALAGGIVMVSGTATYLGLSPLFCGLFFGITLVNSTAAPEKLIATLTRVERPFYFVLLILGGAAWRPSERAWLVLVLLFLAARAAGKVGGGRLAARMNGALGELGSHWGRGLFGQGRVALALGLSYFHQDDALFSNLVFTAAIASVILTEFLSARAARSVIGGLPGPTLPIARAAEP